MGRRVAVAVPNHEFSSSGDESTPLEKGEPPAGPECGPATSYKSDEGSEYPPVLRSLRGDRWTQLGALM